MELGQSGSTVRFPTEPEDQILTFLVLLSYLVAVGRRPAASRPCQGAAVPGERGCPIGP